MNDFGIGQPVRRTEDLALLTGNGCYVDDISFPDQAYACFLRAPLAHADIRYLDADAAKKLPGILEIFVAADLAADGLDGIVPCVQQLPTADGTRLDNVGRRILSGERILHLGEPIALAVADSVDAAKDAIEQIEVQYEPLSVVASMDAARIPNAPAIRSNAPDNIAFHWEVGDAKTVEDVFTSAHHVAKIKLVNNRLVQNSIETRAALGLYDEVNGSYTLYTSSQGAHVVKDQLAQSTLKVPAEKIRVIVQHVGGGFGSKFGHHLEEMLVLWAANKVGRPVKWTAGRDEAFVADNQGRDQVNTAELAIDENAQFLALRIRTLANMGAYLSQYGPAPPTFIGGPMATGVYAIPQLHVTVRGVFTNTVPTGPFRGAGRPEASYLIERLVDSAARDLDWSPVEIRRKNFVGASDMPYTAPTGAVYDSGDFARNLDDALKIIDWDEFEDRRLESLKNGKLRGIGLSTYIEISGGPYEEEATVIVDEDAAATVYIGTQDSGQGHQTTYAQLIADRLGISFDKIRVIQGDTQPIAFGSGTVASRSTSVGCETLLEAVDQLIEKGKKISAKLLQANLSEIKFDTGRFVAGGGGYSIDLAELARMAQDPGNLSDPGMKPGLDGWAHYAPKAGSFPNGCHVCEIEIDEETGVIEILRHVSVDDFGTIVNPLLVSGQVHGGLATGIGQALLEETVFDPDSGQLVTGSFMDYTMPRADDLPRFDLYFNEVRCASNTLGVKGAAESGAIGTPPAIVNAALDALGAMGVTHIDMPLTAEKVWRAIRQARAKTVS